MLSHRVSRGAGELAPVPLLVAWGVRDRSAAAGGGSRLTNSNEKPASFSEKLRLLHPAVRAQLDVIEIRLRRPVVLVRAGETQPAPESRGGGAAEHQRVLAGAAHVAQHQPVRAVTVTGVGRDRQ